MNINVAENIYRRLNIVYSNLGQIYTKSRIAHLREHTAAHSGVSYLRHNTHTLNLVKHN